MIVGAIDAVAKGGVPVPGLLGIAVLIGVVKDFRLRRRLLTEHAQKIPK
jgi:hypothetical protein